VIVDEAQNLSAETLEQVRLLTNLETPTQKLLQIILIANLNCAICWIATDLRQLAQRITGRYHLKRCRARKRKDTCAIDCVSLEPPVRYSRPARCASCTGCRPA